MTNAMVNNEGVFNNEMLNEEQLEKVSGGGGLAVGTIIAAVGIVAKSADNTAKDLRELVHSYEYQRMSNLGKEKAIGKILANSVAFNGAVAAMVTLGVGVVQVKFRTVGVSKTVREFVEKTF